MRVMQSGRFLRPIFTLAFGVAVYSGAAQTASAEWLTEVSSDIFNDGDKATMIGGSNMMQFLYFECTTDDLPTFAYVERMNNPEEIAGIPGKLLIQIDDKEKWSFDALSYTHNVDYVGFVANSGEEIFEIIDGLEGAMQKVVVGIEVIGQQQSGEFDVRGSTAAARRFKEA